MKKRIIAPSHRRKRKELKKRKKVKIFNSSVPLFYRRKMRISAFN